jgi:hypothetical protein
LPFDNDIVTGCFFIASLPCCWREWHRSYTTRFRFA